MKKRKWIRRFKIAKNWLLLSGFILLGVHFGMENILLGIVAAGLLIMGIFMAMILVTFND